MNQGAIRLYDKLKAKNFKAENICEIGVFIPQESNLLCFIKDNVKTTLVEADPECIAKIHAFFPNYTNISVIEAAVFDFNGEIELSRKGSSTFISSLSASPALVNDNYKVNDQDKFIAKSIKFNEVDPGSFDLISIDIEGAEWYVLKYMKSRPNVLSIETHGKYYTNPNLPQINDWMASNGYEKWYVEDSDTIYIKKGIFNVTLLEKLQMQFKYLTIAIIKQKKLLKKILRVK